MSAADRTVIDGLKTKIVEYLKNPVHGTRRSNLMDEFGLEMGRHLPSGLPQSRALDRALQELRRDGVIEYESKQWGFSR